MNVFFVLIIIRSSIMKNNIPTNALQLIILDLLEQLFSYRVQSVTCTIFFSIAIIAEYIFFKLIVIRSYNFFYQKHTDKCIATPNSEFSQTVF